MQIEKAKSAKQWTAAEQWKTTGNNVFSSSWKAVKGQIVVLIPEKIGLEKAAPRAANVYFHTALTFVAWTWKHRQSEVCECCQTCLLSLSHSLKQLLLFKDLHCIDLAGSEPGPSRLFSPVLAFHYLASHDHLFANWEEKIDVKR